jgi:hypothetical protein
MHSGVACGAKGDLIFFPIGPGVAAKLFVVDLGVQKSQLGRFMRETGYYGA